MVKRMEQFHGRHGTHLSQLMEQDGNMYGPQESFVWKRMEYSYGVRMGQRYGSLWKHEVACMECWYRRIKSLWKSHIAFIHGMYSFVMELPYRIVL
jgi:hypothetical protein